ncbi:hypothetical protein AFB00_17400 [Pseudonocardia sp. HH130630-07]|nr:hypothetical protein AFB00_17400 [Pseudonocardia sp. HH130630-07]
MVDNLARDGWLDTPAVRRAVEVVPRHLFMPAGTSLELAYSDRDAVVTKRDETGRSMSSVSAPWLQAAMIDQAEVGAGSRVLEIGSGGYNAALLAEVVGPDGLVVSVDIDPEVVDRTRTRLQTTGYSGRVQAVVADAAHRVLPDGQLVDAVVVTAGAWDIAPAWFDQLAPGGTLVVPLRMRGATRSIGFRRVDDHLESSSVQVCGFVPMQGADAHDEVRVPLRFPGDPDRQVSLRFDSDTAPDPDSLRVVFDGAPTTVWSRVVLGRRESTADLSLRLATHWPGYCAMDVEDGTELIPRPARWWPHGVAHEGALAYLVHRPTKYPDENGAGDTVELGICARGEGADRLATAMIEQVRAWAASRDATPSFSFWPTGTTPPDVPEDEAADWLHKPHGDLRVTWPPIPADIGGQRG